MMWISDKTTSNPDTDSTPFRATISPLDGESHWPEPDRRAGAQDLDRFSLTTTQSGLTINPGGSASTTVGVIDVGGFSGSVSLAVTSSLPSGVSASFSGNSTSTTSGLTITAGILSQAQTFVVTVTGTSGSAHSYHVSDSQYTHECGCGPQSLLRQPCRCLLNG